MFYILFSRLIHTKIPCSKNKNFCYTKIKYKQKSKPKANSQKLTANSQQPTAKSRYSTTTTASFAFWRTLFGSVIVYSSPFLEMVAFSEEPKIVALPVFTGFSRFLKV